MAPGPLGCYRHSGDTILSAEKATESVITFGRESLALLMGKLLLHLACDFRPKVNTLSATLHWAGRPPGRWAAIDILAPD